jgi:uncharacterized protein YaiE (UPF0345 family)
MARIAGIQFNKTPSGKVKSVTFDLKKHGEVITPVLESLGAIEEDEFEKKWKQGGYTVQEAKARTIQVIKKLPWKK